MMLVALFFAFLITSAEAQKTEYEYIVIGSGPGGGPLAYVRYLVKSIMLTPIVPIWLEQGILSS
jgi:hypothetical protein